MIVCYSPTVARVHVIANLNDEPEEAKQVDWLFKLANNNHHLTHRSKQASKQLSILAYRHQLS